jgi:hypothetical protein
MGYWDSKKPGGATQQTARHAEPHERAAGGGDDPFAAFEQATGISVAQELVPALGEEFIFA